MIASFPFLIFRFSLDLGNRVYFLTKVTPNIAVKARRIGRSQRVIENCFSLVIKFMAFVSDLQAVLGCLT